ncbi:MAG: tRNA epoxyqueuosine(34) reductase QueG [Bacilli bacterium]|nr:tRNA epoxyqueuosine(34) reductase QueG [Bacilli bacterium]
MNKLKQTIQAMFSCQVGFVKARIFTELREKLLRYLAINGEIELVEHDIEKRINPYLIYDKVKTIIVVIFPYTQRNPELDRASHVVSKSSYGIDYHLVLKDKLSIIASYLKDNYNAESIVLTDNHPLHEKHLAYLAGLGNFGKNTLLINPTYGSYFFIGLILTDLELEEYDEPRFSDICQGCNRCIKSCPTQALSESRFIEVYKCMSYLTQSKKLIPDEYLDKFRKYIYGCDICQITCIYNTDNDLPILAEFKPQGKEIIKVKDLEALSNKSFKEKYGDLAANFRGKNVLLRNAILVSANQKNIKDLENLDKLTNTNIEYLNQATDYAKKKLGEGEEK